MLEDIISLYRYNQNIVYGVFLEIILILIIYFILKYLKNKDISILIELLYEKVYNFYENILGIEEKKWVKTYIVILFFVILFSNILGVLLEFIAPIFGVDKNGEFILEHYFTNPTGDLNFTIALSITSIIILLLIQGIKLGFKHFLLEYFPINGKGFIVYDIKESKNIIKIILKYFVKLFDIVLSIFLGLLEILGLFAKIASLSLRLFGNMVSGTILITLVVVGLSLLTQELTVLLGGISFPIILPIFIYLQEILVAFVQALIFPLLMSIFIRVSSLNEN